MTEQQQEDERKAAITWAKEQLQTAIDELTTLHVIDGPTIDGRPVWMLPFKILIAELRESSQKERALWVISGEVPTDQIDAQLAETPRDAARHFVLKWHMHAARQTSTTGDVSNGDVLAKQAEALSALVETDEIWE